MGERSRFGPIHSQKIRPKLLLLSLGFLAILRPVVAKRNVLIAARLFFGLLTLAAISTQLIIQIQSGFSVVNFFSYFTNLSNIFAGIVLIVGAIYLIKPRQPTVAEDIIRGSSVACMALVGIVFGVLLRDVDLGNLLPWVNTVTHYIMPVVVVLDWLYQPPQSKLTVKQIAYWLIFPLLYLAYSIIRGAIVGFYAYPFFNPDKVGRPRWCSSLLSSHSCCVPLRQLAAADIRKQT